MTEGAAGRLQRLLRRADVELIVLDGASVTLGLTDGRTVAGPPIAVDDADLVALIMEELQTWMLHRTTVGLPVPSIDEDALIEAVTAELAGLSRLDPLLLREDVEDIYFNGTAPTMLRLSDGRKVQGPPIAASNDELKAMIRRFGATPGASS